MIHPYSEPKVRNSVVPLRMMGRWSWLELFPEDLSQPCLPCLELCLTGLGISCYNSLSAVVQGI